MLASKLHVGHILGSYEIYVYHLNPFDLKDITIPHHLLSLLLYLIWKKSTIHFNCEFSRNAPVPSVVSASFRLDSTVYCREEPRGEINIWTSCFGYHTFSLVDLVCDKVTTNFFFLINLFSSLVYTYRYLKSLPKGMQQVREVVYFIEREPSLNCWGLFVLFVCLFVFAVHYFWTQSSQNSGQNTLLRGWSKVEYKTINYYCESHKHGIDLVSRNKIANIS